MTHNLKITKNKPERDRRALRDLYRGYMTMKAAPSTNTDKTTLCKCLLGERAAVTEYETILEHKKERTPTTVARAARTYKSHGLYGYIVRRPNRPAVASSWIVIA